MYTYVGFLWFEQNVAVRDDDAAQRVVIPPKDKLVDQSGQGAERLVCIHGHPTELLRFKVRGTFSQKKVEPDRSVPACKENISCGLGILWTRTVPCFPGLSFIF